MKRCISVNKMNNNNRLFLILIQKKSLWPKLEKFVSFCYNDVHCASNGLDHFDYYGEGYCITV